MLGYRHTALPRGRIEQVANTVPIVALQEVRGVLDNWRQTISRAGLDTQKDKLAREWAGGDKKVWHLDYPELVL